MNVTRAIFEVGTAVDCFKSNYKNDTSHETIKNSWEFIKEKLDEFERQTSQGERSHTTAVENIHAFILDGGLNNICGRVEELRDLLTALQESGNTAMPKLPSFDEMWKRISVYQEFSEYLNSIKKSMDCECFYDLLQRQLRQ